jgi:hypothetical protein
MARRKLVDAIAASLMADQALEELGIREKAGHVDYETAEFLAANRAAHDTYHQVPLWARWWSEKLADACWRARGAR